jgi:hypothetical protein
MHHVARDLCEAKSRDQIFSAQNAKWDYVCILVLDNITPK